MADIRHDHDCAQRDGNECSCGVDEIRHLMFNERRINPNPPAADQKELLIAKIEKVYSMAVEQNNPDSALRAVELLARINGYA